MDDQNIFRIAIAPPAPTGVPSTYFTPPAVVAMVEALVAASTSRPLPAAVGTGGVFAEIAERSHESVSPPPWA